MVISLAHQLGHAARAHGAATWLTTPREEVSWEQAWVGVRRTATALREAGVQPGDRVGIFCRNGVEFVQTWFAAQAVGATTVPVNTGFQTNEARYVLEHARVRLLVADTDTVDVVRRARADLPGLDLVVVVDGDSDDLGAHEVGFASFTDLTPLAEDEVHAPTAAETASILYTSGTSGPPKGCLLGHAFFDFGARSVASQLELSEADVMMCVLPLFHMNAQASSVATSLHVGARLVLEDRFSARGFWPRVREQGVTAFSYLGIISAALAKLPPSPLDREHELRVAMGAGMPADLHAGFEDRFGVKMLEVFGMTETCIDLATRLVDDRHVGRRSLGTVVPGKEARIVDEQGQPLADGHPGHLQVRGEGLFQGYLDDPETTASSFDGPWFRTGDLAVRDTDGWFYYVDRSKDIVRRAGENIGSVEVEAVLSAHPAVQSAAVIGVEDDVVGHEVKALVVLQDDHAESPELLDEILRHCATHLAAFKVPRYLQVLPELPRTESLKIRKADLRRTHATPEGSYERTWRRLSQA
ncbi:Long-chain-fatty-acid--CoA ligase [Nocardioides dokdonensis FR1436]|uniref:Long-chain-fatty-acid--CoA ligase n=1 Tax=Nocardioides dokdonensis FR1436 TaxID=1300347 RepID=A0A1A9GHS0_9ACTN|nr:AMP-binding protein [Nocardioides dokdonensis]ANH37626.1 Long-chain-fatty-acid--CoA ligase [Nocardioides dokdonensis FR1436]